MKKRALMFLGKLLLLLLIMLSSATMTFFMIEHPSTIVFFVSGLLTAAFCLVLAKCSSHDA